jgi:hypothetical protein
MTWLQNRPENYLGEYYSPQNEALPSENWYFDRSAQTLVYLPVTRKSFSSGIQKVLAFKVKLVGVSGPVNAARREQGSSGLVLDQLTDQMVANNIHAGTVPRPTTSEKN